MNLIILDSLILILIRYCIFIYFKNEAEKLFQYKSLRCVGFYQKFELTYLNVYRNTFGDFTQIAGLCFYKMTF